MSTPDSYVSKGGPLGGLGGSDCQTTPGTVLRWQVIYSFSDFDDTNFQHAEVSWYPDPPALDFWRRHGVLRAEQPCSLFQRGLNHSGFAFHRRNWKQITSKSKFPHISNLWPNQNALLKPWYFHLTNFDFPINKLQSIIILWKLIWLNKEVNSNCMKIT